MNKSILKKTIGRGFKNGTFHAEGAIFTKVDI